MSEDGEETATQKRQLRRLGATTIVGGLLTIAAAQVFPDPYEPLVGGLGFLAIATLVFEYTEGLQSGLSLGFITAGGRLHVRRRPARPARRAQHRLPPVRAVLPEPRTTAGRRRTPEGERLSRQATAM